MLDWLNSGLPALFTVDGLLRVGRVVLSVLVIVVLARIAIGVGNRVIDHIFVATNGRTRFNRMDEKRARTIASLVKSVTHYTVYFIAGVMVLDGIGINTSSLLAAAGVAGLAIGFGAQNLVKDVVSGFFILFEGQFQVGDYITTAGVSGIVEFTGLRTTWVRAFDGSVHIIPNGEMRMVTNHMGPKMRVMFQVAIPYEEDVDRAIAVLQESFEAIKASGELPDLVEGPSVLGVQELSERGVELLIWAQVKTMTQWAMTRELRKRVKQTLEAHGVRVAFPRRLVVFDQPGAQGVAARPGAVTGSEPSGGGAESDVPGAAALGGREESMGAVPGRVRTVAPPTGRPGTLDVPPGAISATGEEDADDLGPGPDTASQRGTQPKR
ncbi:MAG: hypothetical protein BAA04_03940 [Firmicutes bacterium ZCTH02-B6]|nr:MAG: hypothetical protein BAA04_03940 [Firmicutes bacterium ZCTH02-B6]